MADNIILAIEPSCDDSGVCVLRNGTQILSNVLSSQIDVHEKYGGVVPEIASRKHLESINYLIEKAVDKADVLFSDLSAVAATRGPGLIGALLVGLCAGKALSFSLDIPFIGVNHLKGHIFANKLIYPELKPPYMVLLVSGGHTQLIFINETYTFNTVGGTLDDAAGEAFDKGARILNLGYPGGPVIEQTALNGNPDAVRFPRALREKGNFDFSFSGLKTSLLYYTKRNSTFNLNDIAASYQEAITDILVEKSFKAARKFLGGNSKEAKKIVFAGGVASNQSLRQKAQKKGEKWGYQIYFPPFEYCTDNAAMIAAAGWERYQHNDFDTLMCEAKPSFPL